MEKQVETRIDTANWGVIPRVLLLVALLLSMLGLSATPTTQAASRIQPALLDMVASQPDAKVSVIVQKLAKDNSVEAQVTNLGGIVTKDLSIINAFVAVMTARTAPAVAQLNSVRWVSLDSPVANTGGGGCDAISTSNLVNAYDSAIGADRVWNSSNYIQGQGVGVAVIDSGIKSNLNDFGGSGGGRVVAQVKLNSNASALTDQYGHGTHVAGIIAGNGGNSNGSYIGVAPRANLINIKVSDDTGAASSSDVVAGLQWALNNKSAYNIRVVNLSINSSAAQSYNVDPLDAAVEVLWFNGIVVVVSAGNNGSATLFAPANDPFVITVGATDDRGTASVSDDTVAPFSAYGVTSDGFAKPDLVAPGTNIVSLIASNGETLVQQHPANVVSSNNGYFRMSGTSMAAPMVAGAVALLLQREPNLNPDQVKFRLKSTATSSVLTWPGYDPVRAGAGYLNVYAAVNNSSTVAANTGVAASQLLWTGSQPLTWGSVNWNSVNWNSVNWNSVNWNSVNWNSVNWNSDYWGQ